MSEYIQIRAAVSSVQVEIRETVSRCSESVSWFVSRRDGVGGCRPAEAGGIVLAERNPVKARPL